MNEPSRDPDLLRAELGLSELPFDGENPTSAVKSELEAAAPPTGYKLMPPQGPKRAGYTKRKGQGQSKTRRLMAKASRRRNRKG